MLLSQDWLKLKMIRSSIPVLVDSALRDLEPSQLVLFIQSFGIPVDSMTKLLQTLDTAVTADPEAVSLIMIRDFQITHLLPGLRVCPGQGLHGPAGGCAAQQGGGGGAGVRQGPRPRPQPRQQSGQIITEVILII